jgi:predicted membrane-bound spermidine synthase/glycosyltransferase involved in cell wall biosynthesis
MIDGKTVIVVLPAYNAAKTLEMTLADVPPGIVDEYLLVDDASRDDTAEQAYRLGLPCIRHARNRGYGGNQKTCYTEALRRGADIVVMLHPDYQYSPRLIGSIAWQVASGEYDVVLGSRILGTGALKGGMPHYKYIANRFLTAIENVLLGIKLSEYHTGFRAFSRRVLETLPLHENSDDFVFDNQILAQAASFGFSIGEISCPTKYFPEASSINFRRSVSYGLGVLETAFRFRLHHWGLLRCRLFEQTGRRLEGAMTSRQMGDCQAYRKYRKTVLAIFILSGAAGLMYEVVWARQLVLVFGNTSQAIATILTGFFAGMAIGSVLGGRLADRVRSPLRLYGVIELILVGIVLATPAGFRLIHELYRSVYSALETAPGAITLIRFGLALVALAPATILMGCTLPILARFLARGRDELGGAFGNLYVANTSGAVLGTLLAGFFLIEIVGLNGTLLFGALCTALAGVLALVVHTRSSSIADDRATPVAAAERTTGGNGPDEKRLVEVYRRLALGSAFVMGLTSLGYQVLWTRLLSSGTGNTTYVFTLILSIFLIGLASGATLIARRSTRPADPVALLGLTQLAVAFLALAGVALLSGRVVSLPFVPTTVLVVLPTTLVMGFALPLASCLVGKGDERVGMDVGLLLGVNTTGVIIGTSAMPFLLVPLLGSQRSIVALSLANAGLGAWLLNVSVDGQLTPRWYRRASSAVIAVGAALILLVRPSFVADPIETMVTMRGELFASTEDAVASVQAGRLGKEKHLWVGGTGMTALTVDARLMAVLPMMLRPKAESMLVICFGMGSSFRSALIGGLRVDGVELVPSVPKMFRYYHADADRILADPRGRLVITDGRNYMELTDHKYDLIIVDPPPPIQSSGTAVLYSREFYAASASRLNRGGLMMEWMPFGQTIDEFRAHVRTFVAVLPEVMIAFGPGGYGTFMFGSSEPVHFDESSSREILARPGVLKDLAEPDDSPAATVDSWINVISRLVCLSGAGVPRFAGPGSLITDNRPLTEYFLLRQWTEPGSPPITERSLRAALRPAEAVVGASGPMIRTSRRTDY